MDNIDQIRNKFPFLTGISYSGNEYVGIVQNQDSQIISFYDVERASTLEAKTALIELADTWWWESNRMIPIDVFLFEQMIPFQYCLRTFMNKDVEILFGPVVSLQNILKKRIKRRSIQLIKKVD